MPAHFDTRESGFEFLLTLWHLSALLVELYLVCEVRIIVGTVPTDDDNPRKLQEQAAALDRIITEAQRVKAEVESRLREIRLAGRPATPPIERRKNTRKSR